MQTIKNGQKTMSQLLYESNEIDFAQALWGRTMLPKSMEGLGEYLDKGNKFDIGQALWKSLEDNQIMLGNSIMEGLCTSNENEFAQNLRISQDHGKEYLIRGIEDDRTMFRNSFIEDLGKGLGKGLGEGLGRELVRVGMILLCQKYGIDIDPYNIL